MHTTVAVVGCGRWGSVHLNNLLEMRRDGLIDRVVACDLIMKDTNSFLASDAQYLTWQTMCQHEKLDLIVLATPNDTHYTIGMALLDKGLKTVIEKPFASTLLEATQLVDLARANETVVFSGHLLRHHPGVIRAAQVLAEGQIGKPSSVLYRRTTPRPKPSSTNLYDGLASHGVDTLAYLFPGQFDFSNSNTPHALGQETKAATFEIPALEAESKHAILGRIEVGWGAKHEARDLIIEGDRGAITLDFGQIQSFNLNGTDFQLQAPLNPLRAQILASLGTHQLSLVMGDNLRATVKNMERIKTSTTRYC